MAVITPEPTKASEEIVIFRSKEFLRNNSANIMRVWVKRFVENGDTVKVEHNPVDDILSFRCPDWRTEMQTEMLCEIVHKFGFAKALYQDV